jgi:hypothetical protein
MALTKYPYAAGKNPAYDAWNAQAQFKRNQAWADAALGQQQATENYNAALDRLSQQGAAGARSIDNSMLSRGVFRSGETNRRQAELQGEVLRGRAAADTTKANTFGRISNDLQRALTMLDLEQEQRVQTALGGGGGGGGGGRRTAAATTTVPTATSGPKPLVPVSWMTGPTGAPIYSTSATNRPTRPGLAPVRRY